MRLPVVWQVSEGAWDVGGSGSVAATVRRDGLRTLLARKRPRLRPIYDTVVVAVTGTKRQHWEPMRQALRADDAALHHRLLRLREAAGLSQQVSALRVFDVITWMEGKKRGLGRRSGPSSR